MTITVYLGGPMENVDHTVMTGWRNFAKNRFAPWRIKILDPCRRTHSDPREYKRIFELDMKDLRDADLMLVNLNDHKLAKHGTAIEVFQMNYHLRKPVIAFKSDPSVKHPFFEQLVTEWYSDVESAVQAVIQEYI